MALSDIVQISISLSTSGVTVPNFGTPMILAAHSHYVDRVRTYNSLAGLVADGFTLTEPAYLIAQTLLSANPAVASFKVGRRALPFTQVINLTPSTPVTGTVYAVTIDGHPASYTSVGGDTVASVCTALATAIGALATGVTASGASSTKVVVTASAAGVLHAFTAITSTLAVGDGTTDPGVATDLAAVLAADNSWYGLLLDSNGTAEILAAAAWAEANAVQFFAQTADTAVAASGSSDVASTLVTSAYARTVPWFVTTVASQWLAAGSMGGDFPTNPGSAVLNLKTLPGVATSVLTASQIAQLVTKRVGYYTTIAGVNVTQGGRTPSGEWSDLVRGLDWLKATMQARVFLWLQSTPKRSYTDAQVDALKGEILAVLKQAIGANVLAASPAPVVTAPLVAAVDPIVRSNRHLPNVTWSAQAAGAINDLTISGQVTQ